MLEMIVENEEQELERDGAACREVMESRKGAGAHGKMRLIYADVPNKALRKMATETRNVERAMAYLAAILTLEDTPTVEAVPVVHGYWTKDNRCSECGADIPSDSWRDYIDKSECHYCYSCGAKMDGDGNG